MNRALVIVLPALWLAMVVVARQGGNPWWLLGMAGAVLVLVIMLVVRTRAEANLPDRYADEYQRHRRDRAHRLAYWGLGFPTGMAAGFCWSQLERHYRDDTSLMIGVDAMPLLGVFLFGILVVWTALPSAILALTAPPPLNDDPQETTS